MPYLPLLERAGWHCTVWHATPSYGSRLYIAKFKGGRYLNARMIDLVGMSVMLPRILTAGKFDVVFLQRRLPNIVWIPWPERVLRRTGRRLVYDFDDAIYMGWNSAAGFHSDMKRESAFREIVQFSNQVIAGNQHLASMAGVPSKTTVIPTAIDTDKFSPQGKVELDKQRGLTIGWTGTSSNYPFLYPLVPALRQVAARFPGTALKIISDTAPDQDMLTGLQVKFIRWKAQYEVEQLQDIDVGIMYLPDNRWTRGKCGFKLIQYMALAKPVVASPVGANLDIVKHGVNGYLASNMDEWVHCLGNLLSEAFLREQMGSQARQTIEAEFSVRACFPKLLAVFRRALA